MSISSILYELRTEKGVSQKELAEAIGVSQSTIAKIEVGRNEATASTIRKLAKYFNISTDYLLEFEDDFGVKTSAPMSDDITVEEKQIIKKIRALRKESRELVEQMIDTLADTEKESRQKRA